MIVSFDADFLVDWQGGGFSKGYSKSRVPKNGKMSKHYQFEANMSLTGANADVRIPLKPSIQKLALLKIYEYISGENVNVKLEDKLDAKIKKLASDLKKSSGKGVFITGISDVNAQLIALKINHLINSKVININKLSLIRNGNDTKVDKVVTDVINKSVDGLIMCGVNPSYSLPNSNVFNEALKSLELSVSFSMNNTETAMLSKWVAATPHYLESWGDLEIKSGNYSLIQPTIKPLFDTKQFQEVLLNWIDSNDSYYDYLKLYWNNRILKGLSWNQALHDGVYNLKSVNPSQYINVSLGNRINELKKFC